MIPLDASNRKLQAFMSGAAATTNPTVSLSFYDVLRGSKSDNSEYMRFGQYTLLAGVTETDICDAPPSNGTVRNVEEIHIYNSDTAAVTVTVCVDDNTTNRVIIKQTLNVAETLSYSHNWGWYII